MRKISVVLVALSAMCIGTAACAEAVDTAEATYTTDIFTQENIHSSTRDSEFIKEDIYIQFGKYNDEPILWRCIDTEDENGKLILSDKILTYKAFDTDEHNTNQTSWEGSILRAWLNSDSAEEGGFLNDSNFSDSEKSLMKSVSQWNILPLSRIAAGTTAANEQAQFDDSAALFTNGVKFPWSWHYSISSARQWSFIEYNNVSQFSHVEGAMYRWEDTVFVLDQRQLYNLWKKEGSIFAEPTSAAVKLQAFSEEIGYNRYWGRFAGGNTACCVSEESKYSTVSMEFNFVGVRPAFYLNEANVKVVSGKGTKEEPYIIDGIAQQDTAIFCNGSLIKLDYPTVNESDRILIPMRNAFESLGARVVWNEKDKKIQVLDDNHEITLKIDDNTMKVNESLVMLDVAPKIINDRAYLPVRAIAEALGARVAYIENLNRVVIDRPKLPMDFGEGKGFENWQNGYIEKMEEIHGIDLWKEVYDEEIYPWVSEQ